jgi:4a-hydroxytetrahydrobiopterin dehydratase
MDTLTDMHCEACRADSPRVAGAELSELLTRVPEWEVLHAEGMPKLQRVYAFRDFAQALAFTNRVGTLAEAEDHHPALVTEWGKVTVSWWTHAIGGLHRNDFIMAAKTDTLYGGAE